MNWKSWSPSSVSSVAARKIVRRSVLGPVRDKADIVDEDVKKPNKQARRQTIYKVYTLTGHREPIIFFTVARVSKEIM